MYRSILVFSMLSVVNIAGCSVDPLAVDWPEARLLGRDAPSYRATHEPDVGEPDADNVELVGDLTLSNAIAAALLRNPQLATFAWRIRVREARALQASLLPNPEIELEIEEFAGTGNAAGFDSAESTVLVSQLIELGQKRQKRTRVAELNQDLAAWDYETARVGVVTSVARVFIETLVLQQQVELSTQNLELANSVYTAINKRVEAGATSPLDRTKASVVVARAKIELRRRHRELASARIRLASTWASRSPQFSKVIGDLAGLRDLPDIDALYSAVRLNPDIARWSVEVTQRKARIEQEQSQAVPDLNIGVGAKFLGETNDTAAVVRLSLPLPLFDRNQGNILESRHELAKARQAERAAELRVVTALSEAYQHLAAAHEEAAALRADVLPAAKRAFDGTNTAYTQGKVGYLEVLDAQRTFFEARGQVIGALGAYHRAAVEVEGLIGRPLSSLESPIEETPNSKNHN